MTGIVYKSTGSWYTVKAENNQIFDCRIKGKFRMKGIKSTNPIAVGDVVDFEIDDSHCIRALFNFNLIPGFFYPFLTPQEIQV